MLKSPRIERDDQNEANEYIQSLGGEIGKVVRKTRFALRYFHAVNTLFAFGDIQSIRQAPSIQGVIDELGDDLIRVTQNRLHFDLVLATQGRSLKDAIASINDEIWQPNSFLKNHKKTKGMQACYIDSLVKKSDIYKRTAVENGIWLIEGAINPKNFSWDDPSLSLEKRCEKFFLEEGTGESYWQGIHHMKLSLFRGVPIDYGAWNKQTTFTILPGELDSFSGNCPYINWHERNERVDLMLNRLNDKGKTHGNFRRVYGTKTEWKPVA